MIDLQGTPSFGDRAFARATAAAAGMVLLILGLIALTMTRRSLPVFQEMGLRFLTGRRWSPPDSIFGALPFIWGTAFTAVIAIVVAVPISLGVALFMTQVAPPWVRKPLVYLMDLLAGVPSVVFGLWGVLVLSEHFGLGR
ncbi:MAG TPA: phosphate ABC transporter permease subunit PstC, partial [Polyangia bacterium]